MDLNARVVANVDVRINRWVEKQMPILQLLPFKAVPTKTSIFFGQKKKSVLSRTLQVYIHAICESKQV